MSSLKKGEGYRLDLGAKELHKLFTRVTELYAIHESDGVPLGLATYVRADHRLAALARMSREQLQPVLRAGQALAGTLLANLLEWATQADDPAGLIKQLRTLGAPSIRRLNVAVGLQALKIALETWDSNQTESNEEFWQRTLTENSFVLEQVFSLPCAIVKDKAYIGGKSFSNTGGSIVDFLVKNRVTSNAGLVEIKTPVAKLLAREYRTGIFNPSEELSGAIMQVLNYRRTLEQQYLALAPGDTRPFDSFDPRCAVIVGNASRELTDGTRRKSFELFRNQLAGVSVMTFDELYDKVRRIIEVLETPSTSEEEPRDDDDIAF